MTLRITTIGDGAMATVCSLILAGRPDVALTMWVRDPAHLAEMAARRENVRYLPGVKLVAGMKVEGDGATALKGAELIVCAVLSQYLRGTLTRLKDSRTENEPENLFLVAELRARLAREGS